VLTGDSLFIGDVGRPDLVNLGDGSSVDLARAMYSTIHRRLLTLPDHVVWSCLPTGRDHPAARTCRRN
jgi:hydroxyacylglutathione hydrolase